MTVVFLRSLRCSQSTLGNFFGFVRQTFDGLLSIGRSLQDLYFDCLAFCPNGKKVFDEWLYSQDFGASRYIASSAMEISAWFDKLPPSVFLDVEGVNPGHCLVVPNEAATCLAELNPETGKYMFSVAHRIANLYRAGAIACVVCEGVNLWISDGEVA
jgi:HIT domain